MGAIDTLKKVIANESFARGLIETAIKRIKPEDFEEAMRSKFDPSRLILNHFHSIIEQPKVKPLVQLCLKMYWNEIEDYLTDVRKVYDLLCCNPDLRRLLQKKEARRYLNYACASSYKRLYEWVWMGINPFVGD